MEMIAEQPDSTSSQSVSARATRERKRKNEESTTITRRPKRACATKMAETTSLLKKQSNTTAGKGSGRQSPKRGRQPKIARKQLAKEQKAESSCTVCNYAHIFFEEKVKLKVKDCCVFSYFLRELF